MLSVCWFVNIDSFIFRYYIYPYFAPIRISFNIYINLVLFLNKSYTYNSTWRRITMGHDNHNAGLHFIRYSHNHAKDDYNSYDSAKYMHYTYPSVSIYSLKWALCFTLNMIHNLVPNIINHIIESNAFSSIVLYSALISSGPFILIPPFHPKIHL